MAAPRASLSSLSTSAFTRKPRRSLARVQRATASPSSRATLRPLRRPTTSAARLCSTRRPTARYTRTPPSPISCTSRAPSWPSPPTCSRSRSLHHRASGVPTSQLAQRSALACRLASAGRTPASLPPRSRSRARCPAASLASPSMLRASPPTAWPCRHASSTSGATRPRRTFARRRLFSPTLLRSTACTTAQRDSRTSRPTATSRPLCCAPASSSSAAPRPTRPSSTRCASRRRPARRSTRCSPPAYRRASTSASSTTRQSRLPPTRRPVSPTSRPHGVPSTAARLLPSALTTCSPPRCQRCPTRSHVPPSS
mmetsp:Transcript_30664/g.93829  ORF Transcript_30664/g.93829 Transcript_30664/m.93829 type:complete len:312 (-) Transcript_30664:2678-3613(-)